jgi:hypothetical protein
MLGLNEISAMMPAMVLCFVFYLPTQLVAGLKLRGGWRVAGLVPLPLMAYALWITCVAYQQDSNLWPIVLLFVSPVVLAYLVVLLVLHRTIGRTTSANKIKI